MKTTEQINVVAIQEAYRHGPLDTSGVYVAARGNTHLLARYLHDRMMADCRGSYDADNSPRWISVTREERPDLFADIDSGKVRVKTIGR